MITKLINDWDNPQVAIIVLAVWICLVLYVGIKLKIFTKENIRIGPPKKGEKPIQFFGKQIKTWKEIKLVMLYSFMNQLIISYSGSIIDPWMTNIVQDPKSNVLNMSKQNVMIINNIDNVISWINYIISLAMIFTMQFQFIIPKFAASLLVSNFTTWNYIKNKTFST